MTMNIGDRSEDSMAVTRLLELYGLLEVGRRVSNELLDIRDERVNQVKHRLDRGYYQALEVQAKVARGVDRVFAGMDSL